MPPTVVAQPDLVASLWLLVLANWPSLTALVGLLATFWRVGKVLERTEADHQTLLKLVKLHSLVHPLHEGVLRNLDLVDKDVDDENVDQCPGCSKR